jgi:hypothetical protein
MRFYRGISVPGDKAGDVIKSIQDYGITNQKWRWQTDHHKPDPCLIEKSDLRLEDTRPKGTGVPAVCACGTIEGAAYYAGVHNKTSEDETPIIIEFEHGFDNIAIDGKDFLYTVLQFGDPDCARNIVRAVFGEKGLGYAEKAWANPDQSHRIAIGDLMIHDPDVVSAHYENTLTIAGRYNTRFRNAFTIGLPISALQIVGVQSPSALVSFSQPDVDLASLLRNR